MTQVSFQPRTAPIEPLPQPKRHFPAIAAILQRVALAIILTLYAGAMGGMMGVMEWTASLEDGILSGALIGAVVALAYSMFAPLPTCVESYRMDTLGQLEAVTSNPRALAALNNLKNFFFYPLYRFYRPFDYALFHTEIAAVTARLDPERPGAIRVWRAFLKHLHCTEVKLPGGGKDTIDMSLELRKLQGERPVVRSAWLRTYFGGPSLSALRGIEVIEGKTLGRDERIGSRALRHTLQTNQRSSCIVCRDMETQRVVGFGWYAHTGEGIEIRGPYWDPTYSGLGIDQTLLKQMLDQFRSPTVVTVCLRKSDPACHLFQQFGFAKERGVYGHYRRDPRENGVVLKLNWEAYKRATVPQ